MGKNKTHALPPYWGWTTYTPVIPKFYWDVYSQEQRIKHLCEEYDRLAHYASMLSEEINAIEAVTPEELQAVVDYFNAQLASLKKLIEQLEAGTLQWDVQRGDYRDTVEAQRDMFNDVTVHSMTIAEFNALDLTVESLANCGLNCRGLAVMSYWLVDQFDISDIYKADGTTPTGKFTTKFLSNALVNANGFVYAPKEVQNG